MVFNNPLPTLREEYLKKKRNRKLLKYGFIFSLLALIFGTLIYISRRPELNISSVKLSGGVLVTQPEIENRSLEYLQGTYLWIFPVRNVFLYPKGQLKKYLAESFKRIDTIDIYREDFHTLRVEITERKPYAIWCVGAPVVEPSETGMPDCYFMDQNSTIFAQAPNFSGDAYFKYYGIVDSIDPIGKYYMSSSTEFSEVAGLIDTAKKLSLHPQYLLAKDNNEFSLIISGGGEIYFDTIKPLRNTTENLELLLKTSPLSTFKSSDLPVEYIDLRFGNKLFYKLKN